MNINKLTVGLLVALLSATSAFAWGEAPVKTYEGTTGLPTLQEVTDVMMTANTPAAIYGSGTVTWVFEKVKDGEIVGTLYDRNYMAKVTITFDTEKYTITYKDSTNLNYDGTKIHPSYDKWVTALKLNIDKTFTLKKAAAAPAAAPAAQQ